VYLLFKTSNEHFADNILNIDSIRDEINKQYNMDIEAMRNLGAISKSLLTGTNYHSTSVGTPGTLTIPADTTKLMGGLTTAGPLIVADVNVRDELINLRYTLNRLRCHALYASVFQSWALIKKDKDYITPDLTKVTIPEWDQFRKDLYF
jgi:hypothetical protein